MVDQVKSKSHKTGALPSELAVSKMQVWYHLPFSLNELPDPIAMKESGWSKPDTQIPFEQFNYFHDYVSESLFGCNDKSGVERWVRKNISTKSPIEFEATRVFRKTKDAQKTDEEIQDTQRSNAERLNDAQSEIGTTDEVTKFLGRLFSVELNIVGGVSGQKPQKHRKPALAIMIVGVELDQVCVGENDTLCDPRSLTLADAQNGLEWIRRIFPRWWKNDVPGDALKTVSYKNSHGEKMTLNAWSESEMNQKFSQESRSTPVMPWVARLLHPLVTDNHHLDHFGDDRSFMTSAICVDPKQAKASTTFSKIREGDFFRLAEADKAPFNSTEYAYQKPFLQSLKDQYFYSRHAYDADSQSGNATQYLMSHHHLCTVGVGNYFRTDVLPHTDRYYRHMQYICVLQYYRLLQYSKRLTNLVRDHGEEGQAAEFRAELLDIRTDFLRFTHLYHVSNISSQLQPREMFAKLYKAMGLDGMFAEVEAEMQAATEFVVMLEGREAQEQAREAQKRAENLNQLIALGVPLTLLVGVAGMNILIGDQMAPIGADGKPVGLSLSDQVFHFSAAATVIFFVWGLAQLAILQPEEGDKWWDRFSPAYKVLSLVFATIFAALWAF